MGISADFQRVVVARLRASLAPVRVYDEPDERADMPYISIGPSSFVPRDADCITARVESLQVDVWVSSAGGQAEAKDLTGAVAAALKGWSDKSVLAMHRIELGRVRILDDPRDGVHHGIVQVQARIEE